MDKFSPDFIWYLFLFLIPGFCMTIWLKLFVPMRPENENRDMITCILLSLFLALPWLLYQGWLGNLSYFHRFRDLAFLVAFMLLAPLLGAVILSKIVHNPGRYPWKIFEAWLGVRPVHPIASAWDKSFMSLRKGWVLVTLKDGTQIGGIWNQSAVASSDPAERDLFLRDLYRVDKDGNWTKMSESMGMLIKADQLALIEFFRTR